MRWNTGQQGTRDAGTTGRLFVVEATMPVTRLNHAVLYVRDAKKTAKFFADNLGFEIVNEMSIGGDNQGIFIRAGGSPNDHDLGLFGIGDAAAPSTAGRSSVGMYHLAWEVDTLEELVGYLETLSAVGALVGMSDHGASKSLYAHDPDGIEFELMWAVPEELLAGNESGPQTGALNLEAEIERFGVTTPGRQTSHAPA